MSSFSTKAFWYLKIYKIKYNLNNEYFQDIFVNAYTVMSLTIFCSYKTYRFIIGSRYINL